MGLAYREIHRTGRGLYVKSLTQSSFNLAMINALKKLEIKCVVEIYEMTHFSGALLLTCFPLQLMS